MSTGSSVTSCPPVYRPCVPPYPMPEFTNQNAIVTGSTSGIGEATARLLAERGAKGLLITGRDAARGEEVSADLQSRGCNALFVQADLSEVEECRKIVREAKSALGDIHILVNAAGLSTRGSIYDTSVELWDTLMDVNVRAPFLLMQDCINHMRSRGIEGAIANVLSVTGHGGPPFLAPYSTSKGALATLTKNVAYAVMRYRIRVNGLMLGWADTPHERRVQKEFHGANDDWSETAGQDLPFGRLIQADEAAHTIAWMVSKESGMMTGSLIDFDQSVLGAGHVSRPQPGEPGTE